MKRRIASSCLVFVSKCSTAGKTQAALRRPHSNSKPHKVLASRRVDRETRRAPVSRRLLRSDAAALTNNADVVTLVLTGWMFVHIVCCVLWRGGMECTELAKPKRPTVVCNEDTPARWTLHISPHICLAARSTPGPKSHVWRSGLHKQR